jgi:periplasmic protein TonB
MKHQLTGLNISLFIHAAVFTLIFSVSRLYVTPSMPLAIDIGILTDTEDALKNESLGQVLHQLNKSAKKIKLAKPLVQQQEAAIETARTDKPLSTQETPSETTIAEKSLLTQEAAFNQKPANESLQAHQGGSDTSVSVLVSPVFDAAYLKNPKPPYPAIARRMKLEGTVILQVLVSSDGKPEIARLEKSSGSSVLDQAALTTVQSWSFVPARQGNNPISAWVDVPLRFRLID